MELNAIIKDFSELGEILRNYSSGKSEDTQQKYFRLLEETEKKAQEENPWFTSLFIQKAFEAIGKSLTEQKIKQWLEAYPELKKQVKKPRKVGVVNAGNIPFVGFHDFITVLLSGHIYYGKLSEKDKHLPKAIAKILELINHEYHKKIIFEEETFKNFDAIIATGSNNSARYFNYYFGKYPHIIRSNRNGVAVLTGSESDKEIQALANDIFMYFGMGCRNVSKIYIPDNYNLDKFFKNITGYEFLMDHNKYMNNYDYNKSIFLMNGDMFYDNNFVLLKENTSLSSPISVVYYEYYKNIKQVKKQLENYKDEVQCIVSHSQEFPEAVQPGNSQYPELWDYADNIDTLKFLLNL